jgi:CRISPR-associated protein Csh2
MSEEEIKQNSEVLYLYDARLTNPNGDPDEENKPRMDYETGRNLVSDVRLKRYLRDYWLSLKADVWKELGYPHTQDVWVRRLEEEGAEKVVSAKQRIDQLAKEFGKSNAKEASKDPNFRHWLLERLVDIRLFGATMPIGDEGGRGASLTLTGPVQFSWSYSLNRAEILPSSTITSHFSGREQEEKGEYGTMGKDWRIKYSFLASYGTVSSWRARHTRLTSRDLKLLDRSMRDALPLMATTRSKIGQTPRLYMRIEYKDDRTFLGDLRGSIGLKKAERLEKLQDVELEYTGVVDRLKSARNRVSRVVLWVHDSFVDGATMREALEGVDVGIQSL